MLAQLPHVAGESHTSAHGGVNNLHTRCFIVVTSVDLMVQRTASVSKFDPKSVPNRKQLNDQEQQIRGCCATLFTHILLHSHTHLTMNMCFASPIKQINGVKKLINIVPNPFFFSFFL